MISKLFLLLNTVDGWLAGALGVAPRLCLWGALAGVVSMLIYARTSPGAKIAQLKVRSRELRNQLMRADGEFQDFLRLSTENLKTSFRLVGTTFVPATISALPVLVLATWIHGNVGFVGPADHSELTAAAEGATVVVYLRGQPGTVREHTEMTLAGSSGLRGVALMTGDRVIYEGDPLSPPTPTLGKRQWWHTILEAPSGYLRDDAPVESVSLNVVRRRIVPWAPDWINGWELPFFAAVSLTALAIKLTFRIE
jgi:hypothetical protein